MTIAQLVAGGIGGVILRALWLVTELRWRRHLAGRAGSTGSSLSPPGG